MPRADKVTRVIKTTTVKVLSVNVNTQEPKQTTLVLPIINSNKDKLLNYVRRNYDTDVVKYVNILDAKSQISRYEMPLKDFIKHATITVK